MKNHIFLSIIIPCYNEESNIGSTLDDVLNYLAHKSFSYEIIIVDDGSSDNTAAAAKRKALDFENFSIIINAENKGKGYSLRKGVPCAKGEIILFMDADNSTSIQEFDKFLPYFEQDYDAIIASRRLKGSVVGKSQPITRILLGQVYIFLSRLILNLKHRDLNCGFKAYKNAAAKKIFSLQRLDRWAFDTELLFLINKYDMKVKEVPVRWVHKSTSKVSPIKDGIKSFLDLITIRSNDIYGDYKE